MLCVQIHYTGILIQNFGSILDPDPDPGLLYRYLSILRRNKIKKTLADKNFLTKGTGTGIKKTKKNNENNGTGNNV